MEFQLGAFDLDVPVEQGRQAIALVLLGIGLVPHPYHGRLEQMDDGGEDLFAAEARRGHARGDPAAKLRQRLGERDHMFELQPVANLAEPWMVAVLASPALVLAQRLDMAIWIIADPDARPGRRNGEGSDAREGGPVADEMAVRVSIAKSLSRPAAGQTRRVGGDVGEADRLGGVPGIDESLGLRWL